MASLKKALMVGAACATTFGLSAPAFAGGGHYGHGGYYKGYYGHGGYHRGYNRGYHRGYRHSYGHRRGGGGKAAAIALGVIGGAIILNEVSEARARERAYERAYDDRYYQRRARYDSYSRTPYNRDAYERGFEEGYARAKEGEQVAPATPQGDDLDARLEGARDGQFRRDGGPEPIRFEISEAYDTCTRHARRALSERGFILAAPAAPETADAQSGAWKLTANVSAQNQYGESWSRAMVCEADADRVYLLELI